MISTGIKKMSSTADREIVKRVLGGDKNAFSILVDRYQDRIYSVVLNYAGNPDDAVDIMQETFLKAYNKLASFNQSSAFYTWLYRIAINTAIDALRKRKSRPADSLDDDKYSQIGFEPVSHDISTDPEVSAVRSEQVRMLRNGLSYLSEKLKGVIILHDVEGLSQEEVAEILHIPVGTVKSRVSRGRQELKKVLKEQVGDLL